MTHIVIFNNSEFVTWAIKHERINVHDDVVGVGQGSVVQETDSLKGSVPPVDDNRVCGVRKSPGPPSVPGCDPKTSFPHMVSKCAASEKLHQHAI